MMVDSFVSLEDGVDDEEPLYASLIREIYEAKCPHKIPNIPVLLIKYKDNLRDLYNQIRLKYGPIDKPALQPVANHPTRPCGMPPSGPVGPAEWEADAQARLKVLKAKFQEWNKSRSSAAPKAPQPAAPDPKASTAATKESTPKKRKMR